VVSFLLAFLPKTWSHSSSPLCMQHAMTISSSWIWSLCLYLVSTLMAEIIYRSSTFAWKSLEDGHARPKHARECNVSIKNRFHWMELRFIARSVVSDVRRLHPASLPVFTLQPDYLYPNGGGDSDPSLTPASCYQNASKDERRDPSGGGGATLGYNDLVNNNKFNRTNKHNSQGTTRVTSYVPLNGQKGKTAIQPNLST
jgi:hypothetical protein